MSAAFCAREELLLLRCPCCDTAPQELSPSLEGALPRLVWLSRLEASALPGRRGVENRTGTILEELGDSAV